MAEDIIIRKSIKEDCDIILNLIKELATFQGGCKNVKTTVSMLERDGFGEDPYFICLLAEVKSTKKVVGYAFFVYNFSFTHGKGIHLEDLYVKESFRRLGIGSKLLKSVGEYAKKEDCNALFLHCVDWNVNAIEMYTKKGATNITKSEKLHILRFNKPEFEALFLEIS